MSLVPWVEKVHTQLESEKSKWIREVALEVAYSWGTPATAILEDENPTDTK